MKIKFYSIVCLLLCFITINESATAQSSIAFRAGGFYPASNLMRDIYGDIGAIYELQAETYFAKRAMGWANFSWYSERGHSLGLNDPTTVRIPAVSFGIQIPFYLCRLLTAYVGLGPDIEIITLMNHGEFVQDTSTKTTVGFVVKSGLEYTVYRRLFFTVFTDYVYQPALYATKVDIGGLQFGAGFGLNF